jgi:hypothetical protein
MAEGYLSENGTTKNPCWATLESLMLLQAAGADCVADCHLLQDDPCVTAGLGYSPISSKVARAFLERLGDEERTAVKTGENSEFQKFLMDATAAIWSHHRMTPGIQEPQDIQITIDVLPSVSREPPHISWASPLPEPWPVKVACYWRESDLFLGGSSCLDVGALVGRIAQAIGAIPFSNHGRLIRGGSFCCQRPLLEWLSHQSFEADRVGGRIRNVPVGFIICTELTAERAAALDQDRDGWSRAGLQSNGPFEWKELTVLDSDPLLRGLQLRHIAVRRSCLGEDSSRFQYATFVTNRDRIAGAMASWFVKGAADVNRALGDLGALASGLNPNDSLDKTGYGRFLLAMPTHNLCSAVRRLCFDDGERHVSLNRFREFLLHATGRMAKSERTRKLKISQLKARQLFTRVRKHFELAERATV